jgi:nucleoside-diphosphate-sugar epimerase
MTRILVTGPTGFVGSNYLRFGKNGYIDHIYKRKPIENADGRVIVGDLRESKALDQIIENKYDFIIHAAWIGLPELNKENNKQNYEMYKKLIDRFKEQRNTKHIFLGTCLEYGGLNGAVKETDLGFQLNDFAKTKLLILEYAIESRLEYSWLRLFYTFGIQQHSNSLLNYLITTIKNSKEVNLIDPNKSHDYIYIKNIVSALDQIISKGTNNQVINLGQGECQTNGHIANLILEEFGFEKKYDSTARSEICMYADIEKAKKELDWEPKYSVSQAIAEITQEIKNID